MNLDSLSAAWRRQAGRAPSRNAQEEIEMVRTRAAELGRIVRRRDRLETVVALLMFPLFLWLAVTTPYRISAVGAAIIAAFCIVIPIRLRLARRAAPDPTQPVAHALRAELQRIHAQERLLGSVAWWYLAPLGAGAILFVLGAPAPAMFRIGYAFFVVIFMGLLLRLNLRAVRHQFRPVAREIEEWLTDLDETSIDGASDAS